MDRGIYQNTKTTKIKVAMSRTIRHLLPSDWEDRFHKRMRCDWQLDTEIEVIECNTRQAMIGLLREEKCFHIAVLCTCLQDALQDLTENLEGAHRDDICRGSSNTTTGNLVFSEEVFKLDGFSLIAPRSKSDKLISTMRTKDAGAAGRSLATTKWELHRALWSDLEKTYQFAVREEGSGTRTYIERNILTDLVKKEGNRWRYAKLKTIKETFDSDARMVTAVAESGSDGHKVLAIVPDLILDTPEINTGRISRVRILGVERPFCLVVATDSAGRKEIRACCDFIREVHALYRPSTAETAFIGHGHSFAWLRFKNYIEELGVKCEHFDLKPSAGKDITDRLQEMLDASSLAFLVMTAEDLQPDGTWRTRENLLQELGIYQGKLGFSKAVILLEERCKLPSNLVGLVHIEFRSDNIEAAFGEIAKVLKRENMI